MADPRYEASAYEFAKLALGSLITSCSGALIGLMAFAGQQPHRSLEAAQRLGWAAGWLGAALLAFFNHALLAWGTPRPWLRAVAAGLGVVSLASLAIGGFAAVRMLPAAVG